MPRTVPRRAALALCLLTLGACLSSCGAQRVEPANPQTEFSSWEEATSYVRSHYEVDVMVPESTLIARAEYYRASGRGYLILHFTSQPSKGYIYRGVPPDVWDAFKDASSKGRFYNAAIKGRYAFHLNR